MTFNRCLQLVNQIHNHCSHMFGVILYPSDGTRTADYFNGTGAVTRVTFDVHHMGSQCSDDACFQALYEHMVEDYTEYVKSGAFTTEIMNWAYESVSYLPIV